MVTVEPHRFQKFQNLFLTQYYKDNPVNATWIGIHDYDDQLPDFRPQAVQERLDRLREYRRIFVDIRENELSRDDRIDREIILNSIDQEIFNYTELKSYRWNPLIYMYTLGFAVESLSGYDFAPAEERGLNLKGRLFAIPEFLRVATGNLDTMPAPHMETAIRQCRGIEKLVSTGLDSFLTDLETDETHVIRQAALSAQQSLVQFRSFLEQRLKEGPYRDFRIGPHLYGKKLELTLNENLLPEEVLARAEIALKRIQSQMLELATPLYTELTHEQPSVNGHADELNIIRTVLDDIARNHAKREAVVTSVRSTIDELTRFIQDRQIITLDSTKPLVIRETPEYQRGVSIASLQAPGPLEKNLQTYFNVSPIPTDWTDEQAESFLREYNTISVKILAIHEALPGHYVQLIYANRNPSLARAVFSSGVMVEGWAHYAESMMIDEGLGNGDPRYKLVELKWKLRGIANAIMDQKIHTEDMTREEALDLMINETFQETSEAEAKWRRAQLTSCQLSTYFVGYDLMMALRSDVEADQGPNFNLGAFHEALLNQGSIPIRYLREYLLN
ncbi:MAG: DUF885 domain-containing protein [FCB group bacterium]|nr:DUF885 domain-containing protein [FCB group bacterium]